MTPNIPVHVNVITFGYSLYRGNAHQFYIQRLKNETHNQFSPGPIPCCIHIYELNILK